MDRLKFKNGDTISFATNLGIKQGIIRYILTCPLSDDSDKQRCRGTIYPRCDSNGYAYKASEFMVCPSDIREELGSIKMKLCTRKFRVYE